MADENTEENVEQESSSSGPKNYLLLIFCILNLLSLGAVGYLQFMSMKKMEKIEKISDVVNTAEESQKNTDESINKVPEMDGNLFELLPFTANLAQGDGPRRYIRTQIFLKTTKESDKAELDQKVPLMRDKVITLLNTKRPEDLLTQEGKTFLKEEVKSGINSFLTHSEIIDVFYVSFQVN